MRTFVLAEIGIDQSRNPSAQHLILFEVLCIEDLEPDLEARVANQNSRILLLAFFWAGHEPAVVPIGIFGVETRIQALDDVPGEKIVDPRAIIFTEDEPGLALRIPDDMLSTLSGTGDEEGPL